ncbi:MAG: hypothetical protein ABDH16_00025 [Thermodesulfovibrionaceae bacterium]
MQINSKIFFVVLGIFLFIFLINVGLQAADMKEQFKVKPGQIPTQKKLPPEVEKIRKMLPGTNTDQYEPNNDLYHSKLINPGRYSGTVGGLDDPSDFFIIKVPSSSIFGYLVTFEITFGDAQVFIYSQNKTYLDGYRKKAWVALKPDLNVYVEVRSTTQNKTDYNLDVTIREIRDEFEPNDTYIQAKFRNEGNFWGHLCNVLDHNDDSVGVNDWYSFPLNQPKKLKIEVRNAGLPVTDRVFIYLYEPDAVSLVASTESNWGTSERATLIVDLPSFYAGYTFPVGNWKILVTNYAAGASGYPLPFGVDNPPQSYYRKYDLIISELK